MAVVMFNKCSSHVIEVSAFWRVNSLNDWR
jgi:hypothetical protein